MAWCKWTPAADAKVEALAAKGYSAAEIARALGNDVTRNAVIGRMSRKKIVKPPRETKKTVARISHVRDRVVHITPATPQPVKGIQGGSLFGSDRAISLLDVKVMQCRWPIDGRGADGAPRCCGTATQREMGYCDRHHAIAYHAPRSRHDREQAA